MKLSKHVRRMLEDIGGHSVGMYSNIFEGTIAWIKSYTNPLMGISEHDIDCMKNQIQSSLLDLNQVWSGSVRIYSNLFEGTATCMKAVRHAWHEYAKNIQWLGSPWSSCSCSSCATITRSITMDWLWIKCFLAWRSLVVFPLHSLRSPWFVPHFWESQGHIGCFNVFYNGKKI